MPLLPSKKISVVWFLNRCTSSFTVSSTSIIPHGWDSDSFSCLKHMKLSHIFHLMESFPFPPLLSLHKTLKTRTYLCLHHPIDKWLKIFCEMTWQSHNMVGEYIFSMGIQTKITIEIHPTVTQSPPAPVTHRSRFLCLLPTELWDCPNSTWMADLRNTSKPTSSLVKLWYWNVLTNLTRSNSLYPRAALKMIKESSISAFLYCWACRFLESQL